ARERQRLAGGPVERLLPARHLAAGLEPLRDLLVRVEALGYGGQRLEELREGRARDARRNLRDRRVGSAAVLLPQVPEVVVLADVSLALRLAERQLELLAAADDELVRLLARDAAEQEEVVEVALAHRLASADRLVEQRLRERRLVALVVPPAPV